MITRRGSRETRNRETTAIPTKIGGKNVARVAPERFSTLSDVNTIITVIKRE
jgi:hypothetical protein